MSDEADLDAQADRLFNRREALDLYINAAFEASASARGYLSGGAASTEVREGEVVRFSVMQPDRIVVDLGSDSMAVNRGQELDLLVDRLVIERMAERHMVDPLAKALRVAADAAAGRRAEYEPRWGDEKRAAAEIALYAIRLFPPAAPSSAPSRALDFAEFMKERATRKATP